MVKGCQKKTIHVRDTASEFFEEAYFVLRPGAPSRGCSEDDMIKEALRIAGEGSPRGKGISPRAKRAALFIAGFASGAAAALVAVFMLL